MARHVAVAVSNVASKKVLEDDRRKSMLTACRTLYIANTVSSCQTLGPGRRGVVWVSGCSRGCPGCIAGPIQDISCGVPVSVERLAEEVLSWNNIEGITFSGGEPFEQADGLADLCEIITRRSQLSVMSYSGFTYAALRSSTEAGKQRLLQYLDILVDGPFLKSLRAGLLWRGSSNQQVVFLKDTYRDLEFFVNGAGAGMEIHVSKDGRVYWVGVPEAGFSDNLQNALIDADIRLIDTEAANE